MSKTRFKYIEQAVLTYFLCSIFAAFGSAQDARLIAKNTFPSVVMLEMQDSNNRPTTLGSGFSCVPT